MRCLIVDDNERFLASAVRLLESQGLDVVGCASTGAEALGLAAALSPDVALVDVELGAEDGLNVALRLFAAPRRTPVILISAHEPAALADLTRDTPVPFLAKPSLSAAEIRRLLSSAGPQVGQDS